MSEGPDLRVNSDRLRADLDTLSQIGRAEDLGIHRMAFTPADMAARGWLQDQLRAAGMETWRDGAANVFGRVGRPRDDGDAAAPLLVGSHLDTVPAGGALDGALGVMAGLECLRCLAEEKVPLERPVELVAFSDEEGRFGPPFGSSALSGQLTPEAIHQASDLRGERLVDAMSAQGLDAMEALHARRSPSQIHSYLELHIEQGPVLDRMNRRVAAVDEITGLFKWQARLIGNADHAGTTPMEMRRDAFQGLAEFVGEIPRVLEEHGAEHSVATVGSVRLKPGSANTVPGVVEFSLDVRDPSPEILQALSDAFRRALSAIGRRRGLMFEFEILSEVEPCQCDAEIVGIIERAARSLDLDPHRMPSGAVHDAQLMSKLTRVGMIFVPSKDGRSHSTAEWTHMEDIAAGATVLLRSIVELARVGGPGDSGGAQ